MRIVVYEDGDGYRHRALIRDTDSDNQAAFGVRVDPPDLRMLDWEGVMRDLHNALVDQGIITWMDAQRGDIRGAILTAMHRRLQSLYREVDNGKLSANQDDS